MIGIALCPFCKNFGCNYEEVRSPQAEHSAYHSKTIRR